ncbi:NAD-dependent epimerase/dehydratase family protein [Solibacillus silvestris]|uniref:NAD-dependent epimerase/dehydratase family protein n=1 Tax=Solibacillus silvestris TaxID=76853 RepID=UPI003F80A0FE
MRVLITGGYGFIGSHVAEQFYKEGYEVHILDDLSTGKAENISFKHKSTILSIDDVKCKEIFKSYSFDIVVHLAAQVSVTNSILNPVNDAQSNIVGLLNMLQLAGQHQVKKFIFASSAAIYGNNPGIPLLETENAKPISPYGMSKWIGEQYCTAWGEQHSLDVICLRFSNVYGPRQTNEGEGGVVSIFTSKILKNEPLVIHGDGNQTRDFIYVKDVAFAIFRASQSFVTGTYNLSTNSQTSIHHITDLLTSFHPGTAVTYGPFREGDIYHSSLNNTRIKEVLDWSPLHSFEDGLKKTYEWAVNDFKKKTAEMNKVKKKNATILPSNWKIVKPYVENIALFIVLSIIMLQLNLPIISVFLFGVFYIMTIGSIYGNTQAFLGVALSFILLVYDYIIRGRELVSLLYDTTFLFQIAVFLFIGLIVGYSVQRKNNKIQEQSEQLDDLEKRYRFLEDIHAEVRDVKNELQFRVKNNEDSFGKIHSVIKELDDLEPEIVFSNTVKVVEKIMRCDDVSIYVFNKYHSFLRLVANSDFSKDGASQTSIKVDDTAFVQQIIQTGKPFINRTLAVNAPLMAAPIFYNNELRAIIMINSLPFESFSRYHENLFVVVKELVQSSLSRALEFIKVSEDQRYIENTSILKIDKFKEILEAKEDAKKTYNMPYVLLTYRIAVELLEETSENISKMLRETDYLGFENNHLYILLSNTKNSDLPFILERFENAGYYLDVDEKVNQL